MLNNHKYVHWLLPLVALVSLLMAGCKFDTAVLDERRCSTDDDCEQGFRCIEGVCQGTGGLTDTVEDTDVVEEDVDLCTDFDNDTFLGGVGCEAEPFDCADFDPFVYPGADETCDGKDNDCDGLTDTDDDDYIVVPCPLTEGVCAGSEQACVGGHLQDCTAETYGADYAEVERDVEALCDGLDNDCNGSTDEISRSCFSTELGLDDPALDHAPCRLGTQTCTGDNTWSTCNGEIVPVDEICDPTGLDDDCNGVIDDGCTCIPGQYASCYNYGAGLSDDTLDYPPCVMGTMLCGEDGTYGDCVNERLPSTETCANPGIDDDCDGDNAATDISEELPGPITVNWGDTCNVSGALGACVAGHYRCGTSGLECVSDLVAIPETCANIGVDDDCDGNNDLSDIPGWGEPCKFGDDTQGECRYGTLGCDSGSLVCQSGTPGATDGEGDCDGLDNDCNGLVDDGVDFDYGEQNCGSCGNACNAEVEQCCDGECVPFDDLNNCGGCESSTTPVGDFTCTGTEGCCVGGSNDPPLVTDYSCVDLDYDAANCNSCGGTCLVGADTTCCAGGCVDIFTDENNCGGCGITCDTATEQCCDRTCVPRDDYNNCGSCENQCATVNGHQQECCADNDSFSCVFVWSDTLAERTNCGGCAVNCAGEGADALCCETRDNAGALQGIGQCVDRTADVDYCGDSCEDCNGSPTTGELAYMDCCDSSCSDLRYDEANCGVCGNACDTAVEQCCNGACVPFDDPGNCGGCDGETGAPGDYTCTGTEGCCDDVDNGVSPIGDFTCVDMTADTDHCGFCENACTGADDACCDGICTDTDTDFNHCSSCENSCQTSLGQRCCQSGTCQDCDTCGFTGCP